MLDKMNRGVIYSPSLAAKDKSAGVTVFENKGKGKKKKPKSNYLW